MNPIKTLTQIALMGAASAIIYTVGSSVFAGSHKVIEPGFENPKHFEFYKPTNENGNIEFYLNYDNGIIKTSLPVRPGVNGPMIGSPEYNWGNTDNAKKSKLVEQSWDQDILSESKILIQRKGLDKMWELYVEALEK